MILFPRNVFRVSFNRRLRVIYLDAARFSFGCTGRDNLICRGSDLMKIASFQQATFDIGKIVDDDEGVRVNVFDGIFYFADFEARDDDV